MLSEIFHERGLSLWELVLEGLVISDSASSRAWATVGMRHVHGGTITSKIYKKMVRCTPLWFTLLVAHATATPLRDGSFVTDRGSSGRLRIASGASRSRTGWTVEAEHESSDLRANFKVYTFLVRSVSLASYIST